MKTTLFLGLLFLLTSITLSQNNVFKLGFTGAYPSNYGYDANKYINWNFYNELNLNYWAGWWIGETRKEVLDSLYKYGLYGYFDADTIRWAGYGRIVMHEAELTPSSRFQYLGHYGGIDYTDNSSYGGGARVRYFEALPTGPYSAIPVLYNVHQNRVQSFSGLGYDPNYEVDFPGYPGEPNHSGVANHWYIKPRMRINVADTAVNKPVVKIIALAYNGDTIINQPINTVDFLVNNGHYDGSYIQPRCWCSHQQQTSIGSYFKILHF